MADTGLCTACERTHSTPQVGAVAPPNTEEETGTQRWGNLFTDTQAVCGRAGI